MTRRLVSALGLALMMALSVQAAVRSARLRLIVVPSRAEAEQVISRLENGESFRDLARELSVDPSAARGGYLGLVELENLNADFRRAARSLKPGRHSPPFSSGLEYALLYRLPSDFRFRANQAFEEAERALDADDPGRAVALLEKAVDIYPDFGRAYFRMGVAYGKLGDSAGEIASYRKSIEIVPEFQQAHYNLGRALMEQGDLTGAAGAFQQALALRPDQAEPHVNLAAIHLARGDREAAIRAARKAVDINPLLAGGYYNLGLALGVEDLDGALRNFEMAAAIDPGRLDARLNVVVALAQLGRNSEAVEKVSALLEEHPDLEPARKLMAQLAGTAPTAAAPSRSSAADHAERAREALREGRLEDGIAALRGAVELEPESTEWKSRLNWTLVARGKEEQARGQWGRAIGTWREVLASDPAFVPALKALAEAETVRGDFPAAASYIQRAEAAAPGDPQVIILASRLAYERRDLEGSFDVLKRIDPGRLDAATSLRLIEQLLYLELDEQAFRLLERLSLDPSRKLEAANILVKFSEFEAAERLLGASRGRSERLLRGRMLSTQLRFDEAEAVFKSLLAEARTWPALYFLAQVYIDAGRAAEAVAVLEEARRLEPGNTNIYYKLGQACRNAGRTEEGISWLARGLETEPASYQLNFEMGMLQVELGDLEKARSHFMRVLEEEPDHIRTHYQLGRIHQQLGDRQQARHYLEQFRDLKRRLEEGRQRLLSKKDALKGRTLIPDE